MMSVTRLRLVALAIWCAAAPMLAQHHSSSHSSSAPSATGHGTVHVREYTRSDGTHVREHDRPAHGMAKHGSGARALDGMPLNYGASQDLPSWAATHHLRSTTSTPKVAARTTAPTIAPAPAHHRSNYCEACARTPDGKIARGEAAKRAFRRMTGHPHGRKGYVIDHIVPLACGGKDDTTNMQWQDVASARLKDKTERVPCSHRASR